MASITIRDIDERFKARLADPSSPSWPLHGGGGTRAFFARHCQPDARGRGLLVESIRARIEPLGGVELEIAPSRGDTLTGHLGYMIVLDTNVLSEALRPVPEPSVPDWLSSQPRTSLFITTVTSGAKFSTAFDCSADAETSARTVGCREGKFLMQTSPIRC